MAGLGDVDRGLAGEQDRWLRICRAWILRPQGVTGITGLSFNAAGQLLVASSSGVVYVANLSTQAQFALGPRESQPNAIRYKTAP